MSLPTITITFTNGALGQQAANANRVFGLVCSGATVGSTFILAKAYTLYNYAGLTALGITATNNPAIEKIVREFYAEGVDGKELWLMGFADTVLMSAMVDQTQNYAKLLITAAKGRLRGLMVSRKPAVGYVPTVANGLDGDVALALTNAQALGVWAASTLYAPLYFIIDGYDYSGNAVDLTDLGTLANNRCGVMIGDTVVSSKNAAIGLFAGRLARVPLRRNAAAPKDGALNTTTAFIGANAVEVADNIGIHNKGYITFRTFTGLGGYFFNQDFTATAPTDDYSHFTARATADEAYRIAYTTLLPLLLNEIPINADGTMQLAMVKTWEGLVESAISTGLAGDLSVDVTVQNDKGVQCFIDQNQNVIATGHFAIGIKIRPFGYPSYIDVALGFTVNS